ncbi:ABC transporter ATP-binding protein [Halotalea alkalilenta]|uniref:ABC transporter ATP-binding protein n=1 Tax=Halotalea alkalilenta TaxID=376489 RepID=UPI00048255BE|nr:ABC transporter ATP-binding protein [Halotalea alkalilenta]
MSFLNVERLHKRYGANPVFSEIDFSASRGELVTLLGPSGCGKSTLLRCLAGLTPIDGGRIMLDGEEISNVAPQRRGIAMVFQSYALFPNMTVRDNVAFGLRMQRTRKDELERRVTEVLALVELDGLEARYPHQLSGGQRQRVALARSLVVRPRLLLLDEPLSALDARIRRHLREQIRRIQRELELTMVFVTHDQEEALSLSDRIVLMREGKIVQNGSAETLYTAPKDAFVAGFIGHYNLLDADVAGRLLDRSFSNRVAIRPESIQLDASQGIAGEIVDHSLLGNVIRYRVKARGVELSVDVLNRSASSLLAPGSQVRLAIAEESIREVA